MFETTSQFNDFAISFFDQNIAKNHQGFHRDLPKMDRGSGFFDRWDDLIHSCHQISELFENQTALVRNRCTFFFAMAGVDWRYKLVQHHQHLVTYFASFSQQNRGHVMWKLFCLRCSVGFLTIFDLSWCYWAKQEQPRPSEYRHARTTATWLETYSKLGSQRTNCSHDVMSIAIIIVNLILNQN